MSQTHDYINRYIDTRGNIAQPLTFAQAIVKGIATGGGLFVPEEIPRLSLDEILALAKLSYAERAAFIYKRFNTGLDDALIDELMAVSYGENFDDSSVAPIRCIAEGRYVMELWHGPTSAFKDMALQCLPNFFSAATDILMTTGELESDFLILVATSGDTGKAALEGFKDRAHTRVLVVYPDSGVSDLQRLQMTTQTGDNVAVIAGHGNFDACQNAVKAVFADEEFAAALAANHGLKLSSANSINWGRLLPQIVYYISAYAQMVADGAVASGNAIDVCVPTGNFGNILAAYYAKEMGTPIDRLICASNENCILSDFINTGVYDLNGRSLVSTPSPSMDILIPSNLERQLFEIFGRDAAKVNEIFGELANVGKFELDAASFARVRELFESDYATNDESLQTIRSVYESYGYLMDPHTAVAWKVVEKLRGGGTGYGTGGTGPDGSASDSGNGALNEKPVLIVSTANWAKFGKDVYRALNHIAAGAELPSEAGALTGTELNALIASSASIADASGVPQITIPENLANLDKLERRHNKTCPADAQGIEQAINAWLARSPRF